MPIFARFRPYQHCFTLALVAILAARSIKANPTADQLSLQQVMDQVASAATDVCSPAAECSIAVENLNTGESAAFNGDFPAWAYSSIKWTILATAAHLGITDAIGKIQGCDAFQTTAKNVMTESDNEATGCFLAYISMKKNGRPPLRGSGIADGTAILAINALLHEVIGLSQDTKICKWLYNSDYLHRHPHPNTCPSNRMTAEDSIKFLRWVWENQLRDGMPMQKLFPSYKQSFFVGARHHDAVFHKVGHDYGASTWNDIGLVRLTDGQVIALAIFNHHPNPPANKAGTGQSYKAAYVACAFSNYFFGDNNYNAGCPAW